MRWLEFGVPAEYFPPSARYELGASLTWFRIRRHAELWLSVLDEAESQLAPELI